MKTPVISINGTESTVSHEINSPLGYSVVIRNVLHQTRMTVHLTVGLFAWPFYLDHTKFKFRRRKNKHIISIRSWPVDKSLPLILLVDKSPVYRLQSQEVVANFVLVRVPGIIYCCMQGFFRFLDNLIEKNKKLPDLTRVNLPNIWLW